MLVVIVFQKGQNIMHQANKKTTKAIAETEKELSNKLLKLGRISDEPSSSRNKCGQKK